MGIGPTIIKVMPFLPLTLSLIVFNEFGLKLNKSYAISSIDPCM